MNQAGGPTRPATRGTSSASVGHEDGQEQLRQSEVQHTLVRDRTDRRIGINRIPRPSRGRAYTRAFASTEIRVGFRISPCPTPSMIHLLTRKSVHGKVIHPQSLRGRHPARPGRTVTVTNDDAPEGPSSVDKASPFDE